MASSIDTEWKGYSVSVPSYKIIEDEESGKSRAQYIVQVVRGGKRWRVLHYYNEFLALYQKMAQQFPKECGQLSFPSKRGIGQMLNNIDPKFFQQRRTHLESYMLAVSSIYQPASCEIMKTFLEFPELFRTDEEKKIAVEAFRGGAGKTIIRRLPPLGKIFSDFKTRRAKLAKKLPKHKITLINEMEDQDEAEALIREMLIDQALEGSYFRITRRKVGVDEESMQVGGSRMFLKISRDLEKLLIYTPPKYGEKPSLDDNPAMVIPLLSLLSISTFLKEVNTEISARKQNAVQRRMTVARNERGGVPPAEVGAGVPTDPRRQRAGQPVENDISPLIIRFVYDAPTSTAVTNDYHDQAEEIDPDILEGGKTQLDAETEDYDAAYILSDSIQYLIDKSNNVSENTCYEINVLTSVLTGLRMLDFDDEQVDHAYDPANPPPLPSPPTNYNFVKNDLGSARSQRDLPAAPSGRAAGKRPVPIHGLPSPVKLPPTPTPTSQTHIPTSTPPSAIAKQHPPMPMPRGSSPAPSSVKRPLKPAPILPSGGVPIPRPSVPMPAPVPGTGAGAGTGLPHPPPQLPQKPPGGNCH